MRQRLIAFLLTLAAGLLPVAAMAADAFVQENHTPIVSKPGVGGKVLRWADNGFPLTVVGRQGEWLQVEARRLGQGGAWIPAARVGPVPPSAAGPALASQESEADFRLEVGGVPDIAFRARCLIVEAGRGRLIVFRDATPAAFEFSGDAVSCRVSNLDDAGDLQAMLSNAEGKPITGAPTVARDRSATLRSQGPWGMGGSFDQSLQFVLFRNMPDRNDVVPVFGVQQSGRSPTPVVHGVPVMPFQPMQ